MNKVEQIEDFFQVVTYNGEKISKKFKSFDNANRKLEEINKDRKIHDSRFVLNEKAWGYAVDDVALVKLYKAVAITDTKSGVVWIEFNNGIFSMRFGEQLLQTDNELMIVDILKGLYTWEVETDICKKVTSNNWKTIFDEK